MESVAFDKDVVCRAFSDILSRKYGRKIEFTLVKKDEDEPDGETKEAAGQ